MLLRIVKRGRIAVLIILIILLTYLEQNQIDASNPEIIKNDTTYEMITNIDPNDPLDYPGAPEPAIISFFVVILSIISISYLRKE